MAEVVGTVVDADAVSAAADESMYDDLSGVYTLPQATLRDLATRGVILSVMTFDDHMRPDVHWIEPEEFGAEFERLTAGEEQPASSAPTQDMP